MFTRIPFKFSYITQFFRVAVDIVFVNLVLANITAITNYNDALFDVLLFFMYLCKKVIEAISFACLVATMNKM